MLELRCQSALRNAARSDNPERAFAEAKEVLDAIGDQLEKPKMAGHDIAAAQERLSGLVPRVPAFPSCLARVKALQKTADQFSRDYELGNYVRCSVEARASIAATDQLGAEIAAQEKAARSHLQGWLDWALRAKDFADLFESSLEEVSARDTAEFLPAWERLRTRIGDFVRDRACEVGNLEQMAISQKWNGIPPLCCSQDIEWCQLFKFAELTAGRIIISCPQCEVRLRVPVGKEGRFRCTRCGYVFEST
jgi:hypothetical protein